MSSAINSAKPIAATGTIAAGLTEGACRYRDTELRWAKRLCLLSPLLAVTTIPLVHRFLLWALFLKPVNAGWNVSQAVHSKTAIAVAVAVAAAPWLWLLGLKAESLLSRVRIPWAVVFALSVVIAGSVVLSTSRARWFFVEWAKVRTPNPSFARNTLFWEQRNFEHTQSPQATGKVGLVGSSQTYQGFDLQQLQMACPQLTFEKNCMAGFGPMQYPFLAERIRERGFATIVCQLSEFDFFREDTVPVGRLRWAASASGTKNLAAALTTGQQWQNRSALADIAFSSVVPLWRLRDHFRRTLFGYWWKKSDPRSDDHHQSRRLADAPALAEAIAYLQRNVGHKQLVEANFASFRTFAEQLQRQNVRLIVLEGQVHPQARIAYDTDNLHQKTREQLTEMAHQNNFTYVPDSGMPEFSADDFADAYHLDETGRSKLTEFLAAYLSTAN